MAVAGTPLFPLCRPIPQKSAVVEAPRFGWDYRSLGVGIDLVGWGDIRSPPQDALVHTGDQIQCEAKRLDAIRGDLEF
eukprot:11593000-Alexandrium_andersonii.AAC.1